MNLEFFEMLYASKGFCEVLGKMTLTAGRFESNLRTFLRLKGINISPDKAALCSLISSLEKHSLLSENGVQILRQLKLQRNYLTHNLFDLFSARIDETILPSTDLIPLDVFIYIEKVRGLEENLQGLSKLTEKRIAQLQEQTSNAIASNDYLFRP